MESSPNFDVAYGLLVDVCRAHGIARGRAFALAKEGWLETFMLGGRRYVYVESVHTLPERIGAIKRHGPAQAD